MVSQMQFVWKTCKFFGQGISKFLGLVIDFFFFFKKHLE